MLIASILALSALAAPAEVPSAHEPVLLAQNDAFGDPPPPPAIDDDEAPPPPPPGVEDPAGSGSSEAPQPKQKKKQKQNDDEGEGELGFFEKYWPMSLDDDLHPAVDDILWSFWVSNFIPIVPFAQIWLPMIVLEPKPPKDYLVDAILVYVTHLAPHLVLLAATFPALILVAIPYVGLLMLPCILGCSCLNAAGVVANLLWFMPVAFANNMSRTLKEEELGAKREAWLLLRRERDVAMAY